MLSTLTTTCQCLIHLSSHVLIKILTTFFLKLLLEIIMHILEREHLWTAEKGSAGRDCTSGEYSGGITSHEDWWCPFIVPPLTVYWHTACTYSTPAARQFRGKCSRESLTPPKRSLAALSPHWKNYTVHVVSKKAQNIINNTHHPANSLSLMLLNVVLCFFYSFY